MEKTVQFPTSSGGIMKAKDHIRIARALAGTYNLDGRKRKAFVLGSILPDINVFSYLTFSGKHFLRGHSYTFKQKKMARHIRRPRTHTVCWWLKNGIFLHYVTDSFTGSHDEKRKMSLSTHRQYEHRLHALFCRHWKKLQLRPTEKTVQISKTIERMHREYENTRQGIETDCRMIIDAVRQVMNALAEK